MRPLVRTGLAIRHMKALSTDAPNELEALLLRLVRDAVARFSAGLRASTIELDRGYRFERGPDEHFRARPTRKLIPATMAALFSSPDYERCISSLKADPVVGPHLGQLVGCRETLVRLEPDNVILTLIDAMVNDEGDYVFTEERFWKKWRELTAFFKASEIAHTSIAPLPHLTSSSFPVRVGRNLTIDALTADEVTRCQQIGLFRAAFHRTSFPVIHKDFAVGVRRITLSPKVMGGWPARST